MNIVPGIQERRTDIYGHVWMGVFLDIGAPLMFLHFNGDGDALEQLCIDMVSILYLTQEPYCTITEGFKAEDDNFKAK